MKENFIKSTITLIIGGFLTKALGMIIKIYMARIIGTTGLGLYMLILPTFMLLITLSQFGLPLALSKLISENTKNNKKLFFSILPIAFIINLIIMISIIILAPTISIKLLKNKDLTNSIYIMSLVIPFTTISSICRSYFFGKEKMLPHVLSNLIEQLLRFIIIIKITPLIIPYGVYKTIEFLILSNIFSESLSIIILLLFLPKKIKITKKDLLPNKMYLKESLHISIPNTTSHFIGSIGYFLEPIIITNTLLKVGYSHSFITKEYGIISGYILPLLLLPSFFTLAISQALLPSISKEYARGKKKIIKKKIKQAILLSLFIGLVSTILFLLKPLFFLKTIYHTTEGKKYLKVLAPICLLEYLQSPLSSTLEAIGKSKQVMIITLITTIIRTVLTIILSLLKIGLWSLIISLSISIILMTYYEQKEIKKYL